MSDAATPMNGTTPPKARRPAPEAPAAAPKAAPKAATAKETYANAAAEADAAREKLIATAIHRARARREVMRRWAMEQAEVAGGAVQTRPVTAVGFALGIGVIIGLLLAG
jgi:ElaB/YqjD/DUF883 family membrane-anchored ribosome-binding protein